MLFTIFLIVLIFAATAGGALIYHKTDYNKGDNAAAYVSSVLLLGGLVGFIILLGASSEAAKDPKNHRVTSEKTYTVVESSVPTYEKSKLEFSYVENGKVFPFSEYVDNFSVTMEKPKALKITHYDVVDHSIIPWVINDSTKVEVIK